MRPSSRIMLVPAYLLHHAPWRDSSRILEFFTRDCGRITLFARGVRRPASELRAILQPFQRVLVSWSGRGEAGTLTGAEIDGAVAGLPAGRLMSGFYLNELLIKLLVRHDSHVRLFEAYAEALAGLRDSEHEGRPLRIFEKRLLEELGYGLDLGREAETGAQLDPEGFYHYRPERGACRAVHEAEGTYPGASLAALAAENLADERSLRDAQRLLRAALAACLEGRELRSRTVLRAMRSHDLPGRGT
jgi:DNA repair protein RecO (recombination protein O)